jgi:hypothetical protein
MAKKRRKPHNRPRTQPGASSSVDTAERTGDESGNGTRASTSPVRTTDPAKASATTTASRSRAEKKELARRQREEMRKRAQRAERMRRLMWVTGIGAALALAVFWITKPDEPATRPETLPGELTTEAPWPANGDQAPERAEAIGLPAEGTTMHEHANVQVFVEGEPVAVPTNVGIDEAAQEVLSLHTHEASGTVHMESAEVRDFTLGEFFDVWGVRLSETCVGGYCEEGEAQLRVFKDGQEVTGPIRDLVLDDQSVVVLAFGTEDQLPDPIPDTFDFASVPQ